MVFKSLINRYETARLLNPEVFEDLKLKELLTDFFSLKTADNLWNILKYTCCSEDIILRQQVFKEIKKEEILSYFSELSSVLFEIKNHFEIYNKCDEERKDINFFILAKTYRLFFKTVLNAPQTNSEFIKDFIKEFQKIIISDIYISFEQDYDFIKDKIIQIEPMQIDICVKNGRKVSCYINKTEETSMSFRLREIASKIGISIGENANKRLIEPSSDFFSSIAKLYPKLFADLKLFREKYKNFIDMRILQYKNQLSFYLNMNTFYEKLKKYDIPLCFPAITSKKQIYIRNAYDVTLLIKIKSGIVPNEIDFLPNKGFYILTGANGGGKTTYIRTAGICQLLFMAGGFVPAESARIYPFNNVFTHFPADETFENMGRLKEETERLNNILNFCDENSIIFLNETFSSTNEELSLKISMEYIEKLCKKGVFGIFVTHQHQLSVLAEKLNEIPEVKTKIDNLSTEVDQDFDNVRTYKIVRKKEMKSYAFDILKKYGLTKHQLDNRIGGVSL